MPMFDVETGNQMIRILEDMVNPVKILCCFGNNDKSKETHQFVTEFSQFSPKLSLEILSKNDMILKAKEWDIKDMPMLVVTNEQKTLKGVRFLGTPGGFEINSFLMSILEVSGKIDSLAVADLLVVDRVRSFLKIYIFVSLNCAQCPKAVMNVHRLAIQNQHIHAYMVEAPAFPTITSQYNIQAFPTIQIGDQCIIGENTKEMSNIIKLIKEFI
ncbi:MAG: thioredoxin family protein [Brevinema sp.]